MTRFYGNHHQVRSKSKYWKARYFKSLWETRKPKRSKQDNNNQLRLPVPGPTQGCKACHLQTAKHF